MKRREKDIGGRKNRKQELEIEIEEVAKNRKKEME